MKYLTKENAIRWINHKLSYLCFISERRINYNLAQTIAKLDDVFWKDLIKVAIKRDFLLEL